MEAGYSKGKKQSKNVKDAVINGNKNDNFDGKSNSSSEIYYRNDIMINDSIISDFKNSLKDAKKYIDDENVKTKEQIDSNKIQIDDLKKEISELRLEKGDLEKKVDELTERLNKHEEDVSEKFNKVTENNLSLKKELTDISSVMQSIESDIEKMLKSHSLIIENLCPKEDSSSREMLQVFVKSLGIDLNCSDIEKMHLVGSVEGLTIPRPFLVTFTCHRTKTLIYSKWLKMRISEKAASVSPCRGQGINIKEYLTTFQETVFQEAMKAKGDGLFQDCWTDKGIVYVMKHGRIEKFSRELLKEEDSRCSIM